MLFPTFLNVAHEASSIVTRFAEAARTNLDRSQLLKKLLRRPNIYRERWAATAVASHVSAALGPWSTWNPASSNFCRNFPHPMVVLQDYR